MKFVQLNLFISVKLVMPLENWKDVTERMFIVWTSASITPRSVQRIGADVTREFAEGGRKRMCDFVLRK